MSTLLEVERINSYYGDSHILFDISLHVAKNEVVALLGRNGAGKSTTLKTLMGLVRLSSGKIVLAGMPTQSMRPHAIAALGLQLVPEERRIFGSLSVEENICSRGPVGKRTLAAGTDLGDLSSPAREAAQPRHRSFRR
jgi:branched-chain amino acid transport system ATP-binding protein